MHDYSIARCSRKCAVSDRPLEPGERYRSVIVQSGDGVRRIDIADTHWDGPPEGAIGWWRSRMPEAHSRKLRPAPNGILLDTLSGLVEQPDSQSLAYLLALLLVRRRVLTEEQTMEQLLKEEPEPHWNLVCPADGRRWIVPIAQPSPQALGELQAELTALLFTEE